MASPTFDPGHNAVSVVYVHGTGAGSRKTWKPEWDLALFGRPMQKRTSRVHWAYGASGRRRKGPLKISRILEDAGVESSRSREARSFVEKMTGGFGLDESFSPLRPSSVPDAWRGQRQQEFLRAYVTDAAAYFFNPGVRRHAKRRARAKIAQRWSRVVIVAHGLGSVVAYEVLQEMDEEFGADSRSKGESQMFVTLGSPLGMPAIQDQLRGEEKEIRVPEFLSAWHNFTDANDLIAMDADLANGVLNPGEAVKIQEHQVSNRNLWLPEGWTPHHVSGYLSHPEVRETVHQAVGVDSSDRFVVARDVAFSLSEYGTRQPVLIEALEPEYNACEEDDEARIRRERRQGHLSLAERIEKLAKDVRRVVLRGAEARDSDSERRVIEDARVQTLRKFVAAHLTPGEIQELANKHAEFNIYAMWRSSSKKALTHRSLRPIGADAAHVSFKSRGRGITWAVLDTGCRSDHPHFRARHGQSNIVDVLDCTSHLSGSDADFDALHFPPKSVDSFDEEDPNGHGTHVCGIISGMGAENGREFSGVAPESRLLVYKVLDAQGNGEDAWIIKALDDIHRRNENSSGLAVHGVNLSLGGPFDASVYGCGFSPICQMLRDLWRQGVLVCVAAGNEGQIKVSTADGPFDLNTSLSIGDPANQDDCIAVGSANTDKPHLYGVSHFSSRGPTADGRAKPDLVAPGERIKSANHDFDTKLYRQASGTSMACPHVSGLLAAYLSVRREFIGRPDEVKQILLENCNDLRRHQDHQGHGMPNLLKMLTHS